MEPASRFTEDLWPEGLPEGPPGYRPPAQRPSEESAGAGEDSWVPVDMSKVFTGDFARPKATLGRREDGVSLLYPGREHVVSAEPESAKTWFVCQIVADVLAEGGRVLYVDFEDDEGTIGTRIHWLGTPAKVLCDQTRFRYLRPDTAVVWTRYVELLNFGDDTTPVGPELVVLDGTTEGYGLHSWDINSNEDSPKWRQTYIKPALRAGAATLATDHVTKNKETRGGYAIGAQHKKAGLTGVLFEMQVVDPFGIGLRGKSKVLINKDRNGDLRRFGIRDGKATHFADLVLDATDVDDFPKLWMFPARAEGDEEQAGGPVALDPKVLRMGEVEQVLRLRGPLSARDLRDAVPGKSADTDRAVQSMVNLGRLHEGDMVKGPAKLRHLPGQCREGMRCFIPAAGLSVAA